MIKRRFAKTAIGQVHYWTGGEDRKGNGRLPLVLLHASPFSGRSLNALSEAMEQTRWVVAPDHLGQGDSCAPQHANPTIEYFGDEMAKFLDAIGVEQADFYGTHIGGHVAMDMAIRHPGRVRRLILDGSGIPPTDLKKEYVAHLREAPPFDYNGSQLMWAFGTAKDMYMFFPYYDRDATHRRKRDLGSAEERHRRALELLRNCATYHHAYIAAFEANPGGRKYPLLQQLSEGAFDRVAQMIPNCTAKRYPPGAIVGDYAAAASMFTDWLDG